MIENLDQLVRHRRAEALPPPPVRRLIRERAGLTQHDLASALGVSRPALTCWENGTRAPRHDRRRLYADALRRLTALAAGDAAPDA